MLATKTTPAIQLQEAFEILCAKFDALDDECFYKNKYGTRLGPQVNGNNNAGELVLICRDLFSDTDWIPRAHKLRTITHGRYTVHCQNDVESITCAFEMILTDHKKNRFIIFRYI